MASWCLQSNENRKKMPKESRLSDRSHETRPPQVVPAESLTASEWEQDMLPCWPPCSACVPLNKGTNEVSGSLCSCSGSLSLSSPTQKPPSLKLLYVCLRPKKPGVWSYKNRAMGFDTTATPMLVNRPDSLKLNPQGFALRQPEQRIDNKKR